MILDAVGFAGLLHLGTERAGIERLQVGAVQGGSRGHQPGEAARLVVGVLKSKPAGQLQRAVEVAGRGARRLKLQTGVKDKPP